MKRFAFRGISLLLLFSLLFTLSSCAGNISDDEARVCAEDFINALEVQNYDRAERLLHPESKIDVAYFAQMADESSNLHFAGGVTVEEITVTKTSIYSGSEQSTHKILSVTLLANGTRRVLEMHLLKNRAGFGIYTVDIKGN